MFHGRLRRMCVLLPWIKWPADVTRGPLVDGVVGLNYAPVTSGPWVLSTSGGGRGCGGVAAGAWLRRARLVGMAAEGETGGRGCGGRGCGGVAVEGVAAVGVAAGRGCGGCPRSALFTPPAGLRVWPYPCSPSVVRHIRVCVRWQPGQPRRGRHAGEAAGRAKVQKCDKAGTRGGR